MKRFFFVMALAGALGVATPIGAQAQTPKIEFRTNTFDFGRVAQGEVVRADFIFTNTGNAMLEIANVAPACGCTTAGTWDRQVAPGKTGVIPLQFNTAGFFGPIQKTSTVICNDTSQPSITLNIVGEVWRPVEVIPAYVLFNVTSSLASNQVQSVRITNNLATPLAISDVTSSHPTFKPVLREIKPGKEFELQVHLVPPFTPGATQGTITAKTTATNQPTITITAMAMLQPPVTVFPNSVSLQAGPLLTSVTNHVRFLNNSSAPLQLTNPAITLSNVTVKIQEENPGRLFNAALIFPAGFDLPQGAPAEFTVQTSLPDMPVIKVVIAQQARPAIPAPPPQVIQVTTSPQAGPPSGQPRRSPPPLPNEVPLPGAPSPDK